MNRFNLDHVLVFENLSPRLEELFQQRCAFAFANAAVDLGAMVTRRRREKPHAVLNRAAFGIGSAEVEPADARE